MRAAIFYEGESERNLLDWFFWKCLPGQIVHSNYRDFQTSSGNNDILFFECSGCDDVLPTVQKYSFLFKDSKNTGLVVRDLESLDCYSTSTPRKQLLQHCPMLFQQSHRATLFARPHLEVLYSADLGLFERVIEAQIKSQGGNASNFQGLIKSIDWKNPSSSLGSIFRELGLAYRKSQLAERFFSQFDFSSAQDPYFVRLRSIFGLP
jgi:hypothetical protein